MAAEPVAFSREIENIDIPYDEPFQQWLENEGLASIRKYGSCFCYCETTEKHNSMTWFVLKYGLEYQLVVDDRPMNLFKLSRPSA